MAELTKDDGYHKRQETFTAKLLQYHRANNNPIRRFPLLGGRELDLYHLYVKVQSLGGSERVTRERLWGEVARSFNLPPSVTSASYACRQNFVKYLEAFEREELYGSQIQPEEHSSEHRNHIVHNSARISIQKPSPLTHSLSANSFDASSLSKLPNLAVFSAIPGFSNLLKQLNKSPNLLNQIANMPSLLQLPPNQLQLVQLLLQQLAALQHQSQTVNVVRYDWLVRSLQSGFPNEVDMAMNILLMLSADTNKIFHIHEEPHLLTMLLAHVGVFCENDPYLEDLYHEWYQDSKQDYHALWQEITPEWVHLTALSHQYFREGVMEFMDLFPCKSVLTEDSIESIRVTQVANVIRNFSFEESNARYFSSHEAIIRFLFLTVNSTLPQIKSAALDTLVNLAPFLLIGHECEDMTYLVLSSLHCCILSQDRFAIMRGIEILGQLSWCLHNESPLSQTPSDVFHQIVQLLLAPDYQLVLTCLDALYNLSFFGGKIGEAILRTSNCIDILLQLLTLKVEDLGLQFLDGLSLIHPNGQTESVLSMLSTDQDVDKSSQSSTATAKFTQLRPPVSTGTEISSSVSTTNNVNTQTFKSPQQITSRTPVQLNEQTKLDGCVSQPVLQTTGDISEISENKVTFATQWLQSEYVISQEEFLPKLEVYSKYLAHCAQIRYTNATTLNEFDQIFRKTFPNTTYTSVKISGQVIDLIGGIGLKRTPPVSSNNTITPSPPTSYKPNTLAQKNQPLSSSRSPSPSLSPLQQLIQATRSQSSIKLSTSSTPSPLLYSKKSINYQRPGSTGLRLKRPFINSQSVFPTQKIPSNLNGKNLVDGPTSNDIKMTSPSGGDLSVKNGSPSMNSLSDIEAMVGIEKSVQTESCSSMNLGSSNLSLREQYKGMNGVADDTEVMRLKDGNVLSKRSIDREELDIDNQTKRWKSELDKNDEKSDSQSSTSQIKPTSLSHSPSPLSSASSIITDARNGSPVNNLVNMDIVNTGHSSSVHSPHLLDRPGSRNSLNDSKSRSISPSNTQQEMRSFSPFVSSLTPTNLSEKKTSSSMEKTSSLSSTPVHPSKSQLKPVTLVDKQVSTTSLSSLPGHIPTDQQLDGEHTETTLRPRSSSPAVSLSVLDPGMICLWDNCLMIRNSFNDLFSHIFYDHLSQLTSYPISCLWSGCVNKSKRMKPSLLRHIQTHHCSSEPKPSPLNVADTLLKLRVVASWHNEQESCLTRSLRLTTALVLRNLLDKVPESHRYLIAHESTLAQVAFSNLEASHVAAQCLSLLSSSSLSLSQFPHNTLSHKMS